MHPHNGTLLDSEGEDVGTRDHRTRLETTVLGERHQTQSDSRCGVLFRKKRVAEIQEAD